MPSHRATSDQLAADVAQQREELAGTLHLLQGQVQARARTASRQAAVAAGAMVALALVVVIVKRRRS